MRQATVAVLATWFLVVSVATASVCAGWQPTAAARRACCATSHHDCVGQTAADACCGQAEQSQQPRVQCAVASVNAPSVTALVTPVEVTDLRWIPQHAAAVTFERTIQQRPHGPPFFLTSVLLI